MKETDFYLVQARLLAKLRKECDKRKEAAATHDHVLAAHYYGFKDALDIVAQFDYKELDHNG